MLLVFGAASAVVLLNDLLDVLFFVLVNTFVGLALFEAGAPQPDLEFVKLLFNLTHLGEYLFLERTVSGLQFLHLLLQILNLVWHGYRLLHLPLLSGFWSADRFNHPSSH